MLLVCLGSSSGRSLGCSFLLLCFLTVLWMNSSILSFSFETTLSALLNKAVVTLCFADVGLCDVYLWYWFVCVGFL